MSVKEQVRMLWATCFHDSEAFMDLYFGCRYADSLNEYMESNGLQTRHGNAEGHLPPHRYGAWQ